MEQCKCENNTIAHKKSLIKSIIKDFREFIVLFGFKYRKNVIKNFRRRLRSDKKAADDENEDQYQYQYQINKINITITIQSIGELKLLSICLTKMKITGYI